VGRAPTFIYQVDITYLGCPFGVFYFYHKRL